MTTFRWRIVVGAFGRRSHSRNAGKVGQNKRPSLLARPERHWCAYCAWHAEGWDHVEPWSQTHDNGMDNLVPCCTQCNADKRDLPLVVFLALTIGDPA